MFHIHYILLPKSVYIISKCHPLTELFDWLHIWHWIEHPFLCHTWRETILLSCCWYGMEKRTKERPTLNLSEKASKVGQPWFHSMSCWWAERASIPIEVEMIREAGKGVARLLKSAKKAGQPQFYCRRWISSSHPYSTGWGVAPTGRGVISNQPQFSLYTDILWFLQTCWKEVQKFRPTNQDPLPYQEYLMISPNILKLPSFRNYRVQIQQYCKQLWVRWQLGIN